MPTINGNTNNPVQLKTIDDRIAPLSEILKCFPNKNVPVNPINISSGKISLNPMTGPAMSGNINKGDRNLFCGFPISVIPPHLYGFQSGNW